MTSIGRCTTSSMSRRAVVAGAAGLAATLAVPRLASAATPAHRFRHGAFEVTVVSDGHLALPTSFLAPEAPPAERAALLAAAGQTGTSYQSPTNVTLIRAASDLILVDVGSGARFMPSAGKLVENLEAAGIRRGEITKVVLTHAHPDHIWGIADDFDDLQFPNASYFVAAAEWNFWMGENAFKGLPEERQSFVPGARRSLSRVEDRLAMVKEGSDIAPGIRVLDTAGHSPGHIALELAGENGLVVIGDALTHPLISFGEPDWRSAGDQDGAAGAATRRRLLDRIASDKMRLVGFHLPFPGVGVAERKGGAYRYVAG